MALTPKRIRNLPPAFPAKDGDILPISQMDENGVPSTRGMSHLTFQQDLIEAVADARQDLVDGFTEANTQINQAIADLQEHQMWIDTAVGQIEAIDTGLQSAIDALETKVEHPVQWEEIANKPSTFPPNTPIAWANISNVPATFMPSPHVHNIWDVTGLQAALDAASAAPSAPTWSTLSGKPSTFPPSAHTHVKADITDFAHNHAIADVTGLQTALDSKLTGPVAVASPVAVTPAFGTAYQATVPNKPSFISAMIDAAYTVTVASTLQDTVELRIGPVQTTVANGTGGFVVAVFRASLTGIALVIGLGMGQRNQLSTFLPAGWYWAIRRTQGTTATISSATDQAIG